LHGQFVQHTICTTKKADLIQFPLLLRSHDIDMAHLTVDGGCSALRGIAVRIESASIDT
jgi:hypothetical protein